MVKKSRVRTYDSPQCKYILTGHAALFQASYLIRIYQWLIIYQETSKVMCFTFWLVCAECSATNLI